jgi:hypothetical protein
MNMVGGLSGLVVAVGVLVLVTGSAVDSRNRVSRFANRQSIVEFIKIRS